MIPPVFPLCASCASVRAVFGTDPVRVYPWGQAFGTDGHRPPSPYAVWQLVGGMPENYIGNRSDMDAPTAQIDVYAITETEALDAMKLIRYAIERDCYVTGFITHGIDAETQLYRVGLQTDWHVARD